jgi:hypothetical protein
MVIHARCSDFPFLCRLNIAIRGRVVVRNDRKRLTLVPLRVELDHRLAEEWTAQNIDVVTRGFLTGDFLLNSGRRKHEK